MMNADMRAAGAALDNLATVYLNRALGASDLHGETINGLDSVTIEVNGKHYGISIAKDGDGIRIRTWDGSIGMYAATDDGITVMTYEAK